MLPRAKGLLFPLHFFPLCFVDYLLGLKIAKFVNFELIVVVFSLVNIGVLLFGGRIWAIELDGTDYEE